MDEMETVYHSSVFLVKHIYLSSLNKRNGSSTRLKVALQALDTILRDKKAAIQQPAHTLAAELRE